MDAGGAGRDGLPGSEGAGGRRGSADGMVAWIYRHTYVDAIFSSSDAGDRTKLPTLPSCVTSTNTRSAKLWIRTSVSTPFISFVVCTVGSIVRSLEFVAGQ